MKYALGNMLNGAGGLNADGLALDLQFATDKTLTARKGPTPTFTRASNATVVGSDGLVQLAGSNVALYSGALVIGTGWFAGAIQSVTSVVDELGPDGNNAYKVTEIANTGSHVLFNTGGTGAVEATSIVNGTTYTGSIFVKKVDGSINWIQLTFSSVAFGSSKYANFNIGSGTIGNSSGLASGTSPRIEYYGNGWYKCSASAVATATTTASNLIIALTNNVDATTRLPSYAGSTANKFLAAMGQFQQGTVATTYLPTTTAAVYGPRFDHDPVTLACKGLLIEESRTNLCVNSNLLTSASWLPTATTVVTDAAGPDGTTAYEISETTANSTHSFVNSGANTSTPSTVITTGVAYTQSIFLKKSVGSVDWVQLTFTGAAFVAGQYANFNLNTGVVGNLSGVTSRIEQFPNGWYRCSITATATASVTNGNAVIVQFTNNTNTTVRGLSYTGSTANKILVAMGQLEAGAFPTSYIPTTTASVIRSADVCSISGAPFSTMWNTAEGTLLASGDKTMSQNSTSSYFSLQAGATEVGPLMTRTPTSLLGRIRNNLGADITNLDSAQSPSGEKKVAVTWKSTSDTTDRDYASGGVILAKTNPIAGTAASNQTTLIIGGRPSSAWFNGTISSFRYYRKRLANAKLQTLTV